MIVVIDTTELFKDPWLRGPSWLLLREFRWQEAASLVVPSIVIEEALNHFGERLGKALEGVQRSMAELQKLLPSRSDLCPPACDREQAVADYKEVLTSRLWELGAQQPAYDGIALGAVVSRALQRRKPFDAKGAGFRDALLWETVLQVAQGAAGPVTLITGNTNDFGPHGGLAEDLVADLVARGLPPDRVRVSGSLAAFIDEEVKPRLEKLEALRQAIEDGAFPHFDALDFFADAHREIAERLQEEVMDWGEVPSGFLTPGRLRCPRLAMLATEPEGFDVLDVFRVGEDQITLCIRYPVEGTITWDGAAEDGLPLPPSAGAVSGPVTFTIILSLVLEASTGEVEEFEANDIVISRDRDWPCGESA
jgi:hypothetical protein